MNKVVDIPYPTSNEVKYWLKVWDSLEDYVIQENAINLVFKGPYKNNNIIENIIIKCSLLNDFYSTNIFKVYPVAKHILELNVDERLEKNDLTLVNDIANVEISGKKKNFYSFASKYCSHHNQEIYPIYDSYVKKMLMHFKNIDHFSSFKEKDLRNYDIFIKVLNDFKQFYKLNNFTLKELDKYLWQAGKKYMPNNYK